MSESVSVGLDTSCDITIEGMYRHFGRIKALRGLDLQVRRGAIFGLIGNNGAGKTTAIHCMLGLIPPHDGSVRILGLDPIKRRVDVLRQVGFFPERDAPYEWMRLSTLFKVGELAYKDWDPKLCDDLCGRFKIDPRKKVKELSKGMVAKAKLVYAMSHRPACMVMDEPTSGLDPGARYELLEMIRVLSEERRVTTLLSSHNLGDIEGIATDVGVLHEGQLIFDSKMDRAQKGFELIDVNGEAGEALDGLAASASVARRNGDRAQYLPPKDDGELFQQALAKLPDSAVSRRQLSLFELFHFLTTTDLME